VHGVDVGIVELIEQLDELLGVAAGLEVEIVDVEVVALA
jgi:hypothetical protein